MMEGLASEGCHEKVLIINALYLNAHRTASSLWAKKGAWRQARPPHRVNEGRAEHQAARRDGCEKPSAPVLHDGGPGQRLHRRRGPAGQSARCGVVDRGSGIRCRLVPGRVERQGGTPCIPGRKSRGKVVRYDKRRYKRHNRIKIMFGRLKGWRRIATRYDRCPKAFHSAIALAASSSSGCDDQCVRSLGKV